MSKSKGNLVAPEQYLDTVGADALRLFHLFVGPPQDDVDWDDAGIEGCARFLRRLWRLADPASTAVPEAEDPAPTVDRAAHRLIARVTDEFDRWSYNTAVAAFMEFANLLYKQGQHRVRRRHAAPAAGPVAPHITAELWERRHPGEHVHAQHVAGRRRRAGQLDSVDDGRAGQRQDARRLEVDADLTEAEAEPAGARRPRRCRKRWRARPPRR